MTFSHHRQLPYLPPRHQPSWSQMLVTLEEASAARGIARVQPLPLRGLEDAHLTFSAVQALDPYLKHHQRHTYRAGFIPQPVVRLTADRDEYGALRPGFATAFVNASIVQPVAGVEQHARLIDEWLGVLSSLGFYAHHLVITGSLATWYRPPVCGITLRFRHVGLTLGDAVLLWNADDPTIMATDLGSGMERLRWALTRQCWSRTVYGGLAADADIRALDALRTATLIVGAGVAPASRGPGSGVRRLLRTEFFGVRALGLSRVVRWAHRYWSLVLPLPIPWPEVCRVLEAELFDDN